MPKLIVKHKAEIVMEYILGTKKVTIGRSKGNRIRLNEEAASEEHCILTFAEKKYTVEDLNTAFGTSVNGKNIVKQELAPGDDIKIGEHTLSFRSLGKAKAAQAQGPIAATIPEAYLFGIQGKMHGKKYMISTVETRIGRSKEFNDIWLPKEIDKSVSRRHSTIRFADGKFVITDRRSKNRTFVNQRQVNEEDEVVLKNRDEVLIGKSIFRFMLGDKEDYSNPKKAGIFWVRMFPKIKLLIAFLLLSLGGFLVYYGIQGVMTITAKPAEVYLENINWSPENFSKAWGSYLDSDQLDIIPSPAIGDINGDKINEVIMAGATGKVQVWSGINGDIVWENQLGQSKLTSPVLADINNDDVLDVVIGSDNSRIYVLDGISGQILYKSDFIGGKILFASSPLVADIDQDGFRDIVVATDDRNICFIYSPVTSKHNPYYFKTPEDIMSSPILLKDASGMDRVAIGTNGGKIYLFDASNPESREVVDVTQKINMLKGANLVLNEVSSIPSAADLDEDGSDEIIFASGSYYVSAMNVRNQTLLWSYKIMPFSTQSAPLRYASPVITDLNYDGIGDVIIGWANGKVIALNGRYGDPLWEHFTTSDNRIISSIALADFNKDGIADPLIAGEDGAVFILDGDVNSQERIISNREIISGKVTSTPVIGDINSDGYLEVVLTAHNNSIHVLASPTMDFKNKVIWPSFKGDSANSGSLVISSNIILFQIFAGVGVLLVIIILIMVSTGRKKKIKNKPRIIDGRKK